MHTPSRATAGALCVLLASSCGFSHVNRDNASRPETAIGSGARIVMPGEAMPSMSAPPESEGESSDPPMLGGSTQQVDTSRRDRDVPLGPLFTLFGYPFFLFGKTVSQEADQALAEREKESAEPKLPKKKLSPQDRAQSERVARENELMREQLRRQERPAAEPIATAAPLPSAQRSAPATSSGGRSLREELAALERSLGQPATTESAPSSSMAPTASRPRTPQTTGADREARDENKDGRPDRVLIYDENRKLARSEEDLDFDGTFETFSEYRNGEISRRRADTNADGEPDRWSYYRNGELIRDESDRNGDGFRDLVTRYENGQIKRTEEDRNNDGQADCIEIFAGKDLAERHEDLDGDGKPDVASFYHAGKLVRRELSSTEVLERWGETQSEPVEEKR